MKGLFFSTEKGLRLREDLPTPQEVPGEALISVLYAGICSTCCISNTAMQDLEIIKGYVPGYNNVLGHEFVGTVKSCADRPDLVGRRVVGEINCPSDDTYQHEDKIFMRNHYPRRTVLGIIARDGALAQYTSLPASNLFLVPDDITDKQAAFTEPLAAACRILEQQVIKTTDKVAIIGDGKLGLLVAQLLALQAERHGSPKPLHIGRHQKKLDLVSGTTTLVMQQSDELADEQKQAFDVCIEATGSSKGILIATQLVRPLGTVVQKSTCSAVNDPEMPDWSSIANDVVVNEKKLVGSRCGPFLPALDALKRTEVRRLVENMVDAIFPISHGLKAVEKAQSKGTLKVLVDMTP